MRIGVDAACWANGRGYGRFTRELVTAMVRRAPADRFVLFADARAAAELEPPGPNAEVHVVPQRLAPTLAASAAGHRTMSDMLRFTRAVWRRRPDVFFSPSTYTYFPLPPGLPAVVTIHDVIAERFPTLTLPTRRARLFWSLKTRLALAQARAVATVSEFSAAEISAVLGVPRTRLHVLGEAPAAVYRPCEDRGAIDAAARRAGVPAGSPWFVYVGGFNPHKRVELAVRAHAALVRGAASPPYLVLVGTTAGDVFLGALEEIRRTIAAAGTEALVRWTGFLGDEALRPLLAGATALLLPSRHEGFGLPAVEAAACGTPVVATTASPLPQLLAGGGLFVAPDDLGALTDAMCALLRDEAARQRMGAEARRRASALSWERPADTALAALRAVTRSAVDGVTPASRAAGAREASCARS
ncbi:MAG TPA: glycosyltransferase family 1 protein [Gemmatimonadaceae bacterium]|nr:glycosyltransferase family 1 protein [Gemmatimonadaceae bacterium]